MIDTLTVTCPDCKNVLVVDAKTGAVIEVRKPLVEEPSGDRFEDARKKVLASTDRAEARFQEAKKREQEKMVKLEALFQQKKEELKDQPIERPERPMDFE